MKYRETRALIQGIIVSLMPATVLGGPVNVNTADVATIARALDGIGRARAQAIVGYRQKEERPV